MKGFSEKFNESLMENFVKRFPQVFLGESLELISQQERIPGGRLDLLFRDAGGKIVIVELQQQVLDRSHLYRSIEYRDILLTEVPDMEVRVVLLCNSLSEKFEKILDIHNIELVVIPQSEFIKKIEALDTAKDDEIELAAVIQKESTNLETSPDARPTPFSIFSRVFEYGKRSHDSSEICAIYDIYPNKWKEDENLKNIYFVGDGKVIEPEISCQSDSLSVPLEIFINRNLRELSEDSWERLIALLDLLPYSTGSERNTKERTFGARYFRAKGRDGTGAPGGISEVRLFESVIHSVQEGDIKNRKMEGIQDYYFDATRGSWNRELLKRDFDEVLKSVYRGRYPDLGNNGFEIRVEKGIGGHDLKSYKQFEHVSLSQAEREFLESGNYSVFGDLFMHVGMKGIDDEKFSTLERLLCHFHLCKNYNLNHECRYSILGPFDLEKLSSDFLEKTSRYFRHWDC